MESDRHFPAAGDRAIARPCVLDEPPALLALFIDFLRLATFVIGGGYAIIAVADDLFSKKRRWLAPGELLDHLPLFQMIPGILAGHAAVYVGRRVAGFAGSLAALAGVALPSVVIFSLVSMGYAAIPLDHPLLLGAFAGLRAALTGVIAVMTVRALGRLGLGRGREDARTRGQKPLERDWRGMGVLVGALVALGAGVGVQWVIGVAVVIGLVRPVGARGFRSSPLAALVFLKYGLLAFGGGYVLVPMYIQDFVGPSAASLQIAAEEFANLMALTQMTPGPIGINAATFFGYRMFGLTGALVATACLLVPGFVLLSLALRSLDRFRENGRVKCLMATIRPVTVALMIVATVSFATMSLVTHGEAGWVFHPVAAGLAAGVALGMASGRVGVVGLILGAAAFGAALQI